MKFDPPTSWKSQPTQFKCPSCGRGPGQVCVNGRGISLFGRPHKTRIKLAKGK